MLEFKGNRSVTRFVIASACVVAAVLVIAACSSSSSTSASSLGIQCPATPDSCSTGSYPPGYSFPASPAYTTGSDDAGPSCGTCTPHCGEVPFNSPTDTLPAGACSTETEACTMQVSHPTCGVPAQNCGSDGYRCSCVSGNWACEVTSVGKGVCICGDSGL